MRGKENSGISQRDEQEKEKEFAYKNVSDNFRIHMNTLLYLLDDLLQKFFLARYMNRFVFQSISGFREFGDPICLKN